MTKQNRIKSIALLTIALLLGVDHLYAIADDVNIQVPFKMVNGLIILEAEVDGVSGSYILDTGANTLLIDGQPEETDESLATPEGDVPMALCQLDQLSIGSFTRYNIPAQIINLNTLKEQLNIELSGIIGGLYFAPHALSLNFSESILSISSVTRHEESIENLNALEFELVNQIPVVKITIEGNLYHFALDSGASVHFIESSILQVLASAKKVDMASQVLTVDKTTVHQERYVLNKFQLGLSSFSGHHFISQDFDHINTEMETPISGILSLSQLSHRQIIFDFSTNTFYY